MKNNYKIIGVSTGLFLALACAAPAMAQGPSYAPIRQNMEERQGNIQERQEQRQAVVQEKKAELTEKRCEVANGRIDGRISQYKTNYDQVESRIERVNERMNQLANKLETKGYDVSKVRSDIQTLEQMRATRRSNYTAFINQLETTKSHDCGSSEGAFKTSLTESKAALATYRDQVKSNWDFIKNTLKVDLQALKNQSL